MRRESAEVSAAARQRLELLGRELGRTVEDGTPTVPMQAVVVPEPGRHARASGWAAGWLEALRDRIPWSPAYLGVVAVLAAGGLAVLAWSVLHAAPEQIAAPAPAGTATPLLVAATPTAAAAGAREVVIDVAGKVRRPGVATLPPGSRVVDAIRHAGGARRGVDLSSLNLARLLVDGEQILVGVPAAPGPAAGAVSSSSPAPGALVNLNTATPEQLDGLPGVGPVTAGKIVDWRTEHGSFTSVDELLDVDGIGTKTLEELAPHVTL